MAFFCLEWISLAQCTSSKFLFLHSFAAGEATRDETPFGIPLFGMRTHRPTHGEER